MRRAFQVTSTTCRSLSRRRWALVLALAGCLGSRAAHLLQRRPLTTAAFAQAVQSRTSQAVTLLGQQDAISIDEELMATPGFSVDQLMELAGLSVASALVDAYPKSKRVLIVAGPGNNGGDGLVAARHLYHFGYSPTVVYPKRSEKQLFVNLVTQCEQLRIPVLTDLPKLKDFDVALDAVFGFSFKGTPREPFAKFLKALQDSSLPVMSVDIPSGWDVEKGDTTGSGLQPDTLISLTAPKKAAAFFRGRHFLGGRFVPPGIVEKYNLQLPEYPGVSQIVELEGWAPER